MENIILLGSKSKSRQRLLSEASIPFKIIEQSVDETILDWNLPLNDLVESIAVYKMEHIILPMGANENETIFVLTADTLGLDSNGNINGKPKDKADAISKIKSYRNGAETGTAFCLDKKIWKNNNWVLDSRIIRFVSAKYLFYVPDNWIERYLQLSIAAGIHYSQVSGAVAIEEFGAQFLKTVEGSYTAIVGLPMYELRESLEELKFW